MAFELNPHTGELVKTYLPRTNFLNTFKKSGAHSIDILGLFPALSGSVCFRPDFTDATDTEDLEIGSAVYDLRRDDCALPNRVDLMNVSPTGSVTISGTPEEDQTLFAITTTIADANGLGTFSYQWSADGSAVSGATSNSYLLTQADVGKAFSVTVSYADGIGFPESLTSTATSAVANVNDPPVGTVTITGTTTQGETLTASASITDEDGIGTFSYQWKADGVAISGATNTTYLLTATEAGKLITCTVSYTDGQGTAESLTSAATAEIAGPPTGTVVITGNTTFGSVLTADTSSIGEPNGINTSTLSYQWKRGTTVISGATSSTYTLVAADVGSTITVTVSYTDNIGTAESLTSSATATVTSLVTTNLKIHLDAGDSNSYNSSTSTTAWNNLVSNSEHFTLVNSPTYSTSNGGEFQFTGTDDYATITNSSSISAARTSGTVQFWFRSINGSLGNINWGRILSVRSYSAGPDFPNFIAITKNSGSNIHLHISYATKPGNLQNGFTNPTNTDNYINIAFTWSQSQSDMNLNIYFNGSSIHSSTETMTPYHSSASVITLGANSVSVPTGASDNTDIAFTSFMLYDRALTATEVVTNYDATKARHGH